MYVIHILKYNTLPYDGCITPDNSCEIKYDVNKYSGVLSHGFKSKVSGSTLINLNYKQKKKTMGNKKYKNNNILKRNWILLNQ